MDSSGWWDIFIYIFLNFPKHPLLFWYLLLQKNVYNIKCTILTILSVQISGIKYTHNVVIKLSQPYNLRTLSSPSYPLPAPGNLYSTFCLYEFVFSGYFISMESYNMWPLCLAYFNYYNVFKVHPCYSIMSILHSFLWPNNIPLYVYNPFCSSIHLSMDTWVVFIFGLLSIVLL